VATNKNGIMNREIKFRAWDGQKMWYPETKTADGNNTYFAFYHGERVIPWGLYDNTLGNRIITGDQKAIFNSPGILMQFTGLKDLKRRNVFEHDIIQATYGKKRTEFVGVVKWDEDGLEWIASYKSDWMSLCHLENIVVMGNVYENPNY
jgi:uncharacterized phage protein (TIGR01671 family)